MPPVLPALQSGLRRVLPLAAKRLPAVLGCLRARLLQLRDPPRHGGLCVRLGDARTAREQPHQPRHRPQRSVRLGTPPRLRREEPRLVDRRASRGVDGVLAVPRRGALGARERRRVDHDLRAARAHRGAPPPHAEQWVRGIHGESPLAIHPQGMLILGRTFLAAVLGAAVATVAAAEPRKPSKAVQASAASASAHHRGMRGEASPHNGWAAYGHLTLDVGTDRYFVYDQTAAEFSATVIDRATEEIKIRGVSIPGAGIFYYPADASRCAPDALERVGLYAEQLLFYLSSAFPAGPSSLDAASSGVVIRDVPELHFMEGMMKEHGGARTLVTATPQASGNIEFLLEDDKDRVKGVWQPRRGRAVIPDDEPLLDWNACWAGRSTRSADGKSAFKPQLANTDTLNSFGDVRKALRANRRQGKK